METEILNDLENNLKKSIESLDGRLKKISAGRANPAILDSVMVDYYGSPTPLKSLVTISIPEARQLMLKPFDKSSLSNIEKAIFEADLGYTPNNDGECIRIIIPALTEERRRELVKQAKAICEDSKVSIRNNRHDAIEMLKDADLPEDVEKRSEERVQESVNKYNKIVDEKLEEKTKDLMTV
ncbi:MAG: ribosome recycling factor [Bacilli bacterium]|nr:ribosome recycling factor [Bacilli bacterium]